jgi:hypothetical protein
MYVLSLWNPSLPESVRAFVSNHKKVIAVIGFVALLIALVEAWLVSAPMRGRITARFDVWRGHYEVRVYGLPPVWRSEYARLLKNQYGIETHTVAFCIVSETLRSYADSYDDVSSAAANRKFGRDVFKECTEAARESWERQRARGRAKE